jgi:hypothetical protein
LSERKSRDFFARDEETQKEFLHYTWCNQCMASDLGMTHPVEYEIAGDVFIEGACAVCGDTVTTELQDDDESSDEQ